MKLSENIKRIRKENNLSQEQLAEKLGVSRQSVSKWESGQSYPEMDKMLKICDMFNYNINELLNENVKEVKEEKQSKNNFNKYVEDFFAYVTKTVNMFSHMKFSQILKCLIEQMFIGVILIILFAIFGAIGDAVFNGFFSWLPHNAFVIVRRIVESIYIIMFWLFAIVVFLHIFKVRYLDYYEIVDIENQKDSNIKEVNEEEANTDKIGTTNTIRLVDNKKERIIIRDPRDSESKFLSGILKVIMFGVKAVVFFIALWLLFFLVMCCIAFICSFMVAKSGMLFVGALICILAAIVGDLVFIEIAYNIIVNKKSKKTRLGLQFLGAVFALGIGLGLIFVDITNFNFESEDSLEKDEYIITMKDNTYIDTWHSVNYVEEKRDDIKFVVSRDKYSTSEIHETKGCITINSYANDYESFNIIRDIKDCINNKVIPFSVAEEKVTIYASKENIEKMRENYITARNNQENSYYINQIEKKDARIEELEDEIVTITDEKDEEIKDLQDQIDLLNEKIELLKENI